MCTQIFRTIALGLVFGLIAVPVTAQTGRQIELQKKFLGSLKYSYGNNASQNVYTFSGLNFKPHFKDLLGQHPDALQEANKALPYNFIAVMGYLTLVAGSALGLANALEDAEDVSNDRLPEDSSDSTDLVLIIVGGVVGATGSILGHMHLENGVSIFNEYKGRVYQGPGVSNFQMSIIPQIHGYRLSLSLSVHWL